MSDEIRYEADRGGVGVTVNGYPLDPRTDLIDHSGGRLSWGDLSAASAQLALAILADFLRRHGVAHADAYAARHHQSFKRDLVIHLNRRSWALSDLDLATSVHAIAPEAFRPPARRRATETDSTTRRDREHDETRDRKTA